jgi:hypothetical protein
MATTATYPTGNGMMSNDEWVPCQNADGRMYWYNKNSGQVTWDRPQTTPSFPQQPQSSRVNYQQVNNTQNQEPQRVNYQQQNNFIPQQQPVYQRTVMNPPQRPNYQQQNQTKYMQGQNHRAPQQNPQSYSMPTTQTKPQPPQDDWTRTMEANLQKMSIVELERQLGSMGFRGDGLRGKQDLISALIGVYMSKKQRGEPLPSNSIPRTTSNPTPSSSGPPGFNRNQHSPQQNRPQPSTPQRPQPPPVANDKVVNWGAVRQLDDGQWQTRTPDGAILKELFSTREEATEFLRNRRRQEIQEPPKQQQPPPRPMPPRETRSYNNHNYRHESRQNHPPPPPQHKPQKRIANPHIAHEPPTTIRNPSPPAYIAPMPADLWDDEDDDVPLDFFQIPGLPTVNEQRPVGREIFEHGMERFVLTSSVDLKTAYQTGFEEWRPNAHWNYDDSSLRIKITEAFRKINRTAIITQTGIIYTERVERRPQKKLVIQTTKVVFSQTVRYSNKAKFLIRLQHAVEHQLAVALYRANFTRMTGETTPMYVFMAHSSGQEIRLQNGKTITNFSGVVPHVKIRSHREVQMEMVPAEKSFLTKTIRDLMQRGKPKTYFKDTRGLVRTASQLLTVTVVQISDALANEARDPVTDMTIAEMSKKRGSAFSYGDAVVVETSHGLFSSDEVYPAARLSKKEQAARDKHLHKHRYVDRQQAHYDIVVKFHAELLESIRRYDVGLDLNEELICAPAIYLPEVMVKRSDGLEGESIGSKSRNHEWDRLLKKSPANLNLNSMIVITDIRFREQNSLAKIIRAITNRRPWIPEPQYHQINLMEMLKIWDSRPRNQVRVLPSQPLAEEDIQMYFSSYGNVQSMKPSSRGTVIAFRSGASNMQAIFEQSTHIINGVECTVEPNIRFTPTNKKMFVPVFNAMACTDGILVVLPGKEQCPQATQIKNRMTMMINGIDGISPCALQFVMGGHIRHNSKRSLPIIQEALESGLVPKTGAITFEIDSKRCEFDLVIAIDVSAVDGDFVASVVATNNPYEGSLSGMKAIVTKLDTTQKLGNMIQYGQMKKILANLGISGRNILLYRHNACIDSQDLFANEIQACVDFFEGSHVTLVEVTSHTSLRILDVEYPPIKSKQTLDEFIITQKVTRICKKVIEFYIRHISRANPLRYSIIFSTNRDILTLDSEVLIVARFTHHLTKNYVHHKDGSKLPEPLKYADHISKWYCSIIKTMGRQNGPPKFHPKALRPVILS